MQIKISSQKVLVQTHCTMKNSFVGILTIHQITSGKNRYTNGIKENDQSTILSVIKSFLVSEKLVAMKPEIFCSLIIEHNLNYPIHSKYKNKHNILKNKHKYGLKDNKHVPLHKVCNKDENLKLIFKNDEFVS